MFHSAGGTFSFTTEEEKLARDMTNYWGAFVRSGDPNQDSGNTLVWPNSSSKQYLELATPTTVQRRDETTCDFWNRLGYTSSAVYDSP
jgi:carboxylesterase type B